MKVSVDPSGAQGHARCWEICPDVFSLDEEGHADVVDAEVPRPWRTTSATPSATAQAPSP